MADLKQSDRDRIAAQTEAFLRQGGEVRVIPTNVWAEPVIQAGMPVGKAEKHRRNGTRSFVKSARVEPPIPQAAIDHIRANPVPVISTAQDIDDLEREVMSYHNRQA